MVRIAAIGSEHPAVVEATRLALGDVALNHPAWRKAQAIWEWVHTHTRFVSDEETLASAGLAEDAEWLQLPELTLLRREGDCDDFTSLVCSMLECAGVERRIVTIAADPGDPRRFSHVYAAALTECGEIPMDASHGPYFGWEAPRPFRRVEWPA